MWIKETGMCIGQILGSTKIALVCRAHFIAHLGRIANSRNGMVYFSRNLSVRRSSTRIFLVFELFSALLRLT